MNRKRQLTAIAVGIGLASSAQAVLVTFQHGTNSYTGTRDTYLSNVSPQQTNETFGVAAWTRIQGAPGEGDANKSTPLLRFEDIIGGGLGQIPLGSTINSATLTLFGGDSLTTSVELYRLLTNWSESSTWSNSFGANGVDYTPGVEAVSTADTSTSFITNTFYTIDVTASVQAWANGSNNFGWAFINQANIGGNTAIFATRETVTLNRRPLLTVNYTYIPEPSTMALLGLGTCAIARRRRCR